MKKLLLFIAFNICIVANAATFPAIEEADSAYKSGDYAKAINLYKAIADKEGTSAALLYNLGNAYVKSGNPGDAVVYYARALRLAPRSSEIANNLKYAERIVSERNKADLKGKQISVDKDARSFIGSIINTIKYQVPTNTWAMLGAGFFVAMIICIAGYLFMSEVMLRKIGFFCAIFFGFASAIMVIFAFSSSSQITRTDEAVVTAYKTSLLAEPKSDARPVSTPLNKGTIVDILDIEKGVSGKISWYKVRRNSNFLGWISAESVEVI